MDCPRNPQCSEIETLKGRIAELSRVCRGDRLLNKECGKPITEDEQCAAVCGSDEGVTSWSLAHVGCVQADGIVFTLNTPSGWEKLLKRLP